MICNHFFIINATTLAPQLFVHWCESNFFSVLLQDVFAFMAQRKAKIVKLIQAKGHANNGLVVQPNAHAINFRPRKSLDENEPDAAIPKDFRDQMEVIDVKHMGAHFGESGNKFVFAVARAIHLFCNFFDTMQPYVLDFSHAIIFRRFASCVSVNSALTYERDIFDTVLTEEAQHLEVE